MKDLKILLQGYYKYSNKKNYDVEARIWKLDSSLTFTSIAEGFSGSIRKETFKVKGEIISDNKELENKNIGKFLKGSYVLFVEIKS